MPVSTELATFTRWNTALATLLASVGEAQFPVRLMRALGLLAPSDPPSLVFVFRAGRPPTVVYEGEPSTEVRRNVDVYLDGAYVLDPCYRAGRDGGTSGFYRLRELAPVGFRRSEYYRGYFARAGILDEVGYIVPLGDGSFVNVSLSRARAPRYPARALALLAAAAPPVIQLVARHWGDPALDGVEPRAGGGAERVEQVLADFGGDRLTAREHEVLQLVLRGHSVKSAARALDVSVDTIKLHRRNVYAKLGAASQAELLARLVAELTDAGDALRTATYPSG